MRTWHFRFALLTCDHHHLPLASLDHALTTRNLDGHLDGERSGSRSERITTAAGTCVVLLAHGWTTASPLRRGESTDTHRILMRPQRCRRCFSSPNPRRKSSPRCSMSSAAAKKMWGGQVQSFHSAKGYHILGLCAMTRHRLRAPTALCFGRTGARTTFNGGSLRHVLV